MLGSHTVVLVCRFVMPLGCWLAETDHWELPFEAMWAGLLPLLPTHIRWIWLL